ncbi:hypothetical protein B0H34DRAFT_838319 [Crassisporium funariophilum]|nr:hypothetical protein B0H34DRAFT_838319 [Crassisporium funariophilum]
MAPHPPSPDPTTNHSPSLLADASSLELLRAGASHEWSPPTKSPRENTVTLTFRDVVQRRRLQANTSPPRRIRVTGGGGARDIDDSRPAHVEVVGVERVVERAGDFEPTQPTAGYVEGCTIREGVEGIIGRHTWCRTKAAVHMMMRVSTTDGWTLEFELGPASTCTQHAANGQQLALSHGTQHLTGTASAAAALSTPAQIPSSDGDDGDGRCRLACPERASHPILSFSPFSLTNEFTFPPATAPAPDTLSQHREREPIQALLDDFGLRGGWRRDGRYDEPGSAHVELVGVEQVAADPNDGSRHPDDSNGQHTKAGKQHSTTTASSAAASPTPSHPPPSDGLLRPIPDSFI